MVHLNCPNLWIKQIHFLKSLIKKSLALAWWINPKGQDDKRLHPTLWSYMPNRNTEGPNIGLIIV